jgi:hypothetical protein
MNVEELRKVHPFYKERADAWEFMSLAYKGGPDFVEACLTKHPRESEDNYKKRLGEAYVFNFPAAIVDLFSFYLTEKPANRDLNGLELADKQFQMFIEDCDRHDNDYDVWLTNTQKLASIHGHVGIIVDKPNIKGDIQTVSQEIQNRIYPYVVTYTPPNILDWQYELNPMTGAMELEMLKLREVDEAGDVMYIIWHKDSWEKWKIVEDSGANSSAKRESAVMVDNNPHPLKKIPFIIMMNHTELDNPKAGVSDLKDIAYINASIVRNMSSGEEIIENAAFPMLRLPRERDMGDEENIDDVPVGVRAVFEFDPEYSEGGKPDWMATEVKDPLEAILDWVDRKTDEIFRIAHLSGVHGQRKSNNEVASGLALKYEFQQLNAVLMQKNRNLVEADKKILYYWLLWQGQTKVFENIKISRPKNFSIEELREALDTLIESMKKRYQQNLQEKGANAYCEKRHP